ncbi:MAG: hypothetical protein H7A47_14360 [Verrucomicrobiales bacterium]|nr:hypothetical protein [Verrucomicrobiales bacterium]
MHSAARQRPRLERGRLPALAAVWLLLALSWLAVDRHLHACLHEDADQPNHQCVLTLVAAGQLEAAPPMLAPPPPPGVTREGLPVRLAPAKGTTVRLPPACGPPAA